MKLFLRFSSLAMARIKQSLHLLQDAIKGWVPQQAPVLIPIPIPVERRARQLDRRHHAWRD